VLALIAEDVPDVWASICSIIKRIVCWCLHWLLEMYPMSESEIIKALLDVVIKRIMGTLRCKRFRWFACLRHNPCCILHDSMPIPNTLVTSTSLSLSWTVPTKTAFSFLLTVWRRLRAMSRSHETAPDRRCHLRDAWWYCKHHASLLFLSHRVTCI
jgi:hypothetical protein